MNRRLARRDADRLAHAQAVDRARLKPATCTLCGRQRPVRLAYFDPNRAGMTSVCTDCCEEAAAAD